MTSFNSELIKLVINKYTLADLNRITSIMLEDYRNVIDILKSIPKEIINNENSAVLTLIIEKIKLIDLEKEMNKSNSHIHNQTQILDLEKADDSIINTIMSYLDELLNMYIPDVKLGLLCSSIDNLESLFPITEVQDLLINSILYKDYGAYSKESVYDLIKYVGYNECLEFKLDEIVIKEDSDREYSEEFFKQLEIIKSEYLKIKKEILQKAKLTPTVSNIVRKLQK